MYLGWTDYPNYNIKAVNCILFDIIEQGFLLPNEQLKRLLYSLYQYVDGSKSDLETIGNIINDKFQIMKALKPKTKYRLDALVNKKYLIVDQGVIDDRAANLDYCNNCATVFWRQDIIHNRCGFCKSLYCNPCNRIVFHKCQTETCKVNICEKCIICYICNEKARIQAIIEYNNIELYPEYDDIELNIEY